MTISNRMSDLVLAERNYQRAMSGKLTKASLHRLNDFRGETLEPEETTVLCTACLKTSGLNVALRVVNGGRDPGDVGGILDLPMPIIFDIFSRLPLKQVFICRSTCKTFRYLLSRPNYDFLSLDKAQPCLLLREFSRKQYPNFFNKKAYVTDLADETPSTFFYSKAYLVDLEETTGLASPLNSSANPSALVKHEIYSLPAGKIEIVGSCNGLVCLHQKKTAQYYICNPLLGEWTVLPSPSYDSTNAATYSLFGFCPNLKRYKVIRFISSSSQLSVSAAVEIITVGTSSWRYVGKGPRPRPQGSFSPCPMGDLLFTMDLSGGSTIICVFNLETELFQLVPSPPHFSTDYLLNLSWVNVGWLHDSLCICYIHNESTLQIWTTDNNNVTNPTWSLKSSASFRYWNLLFRLDKHHPSVFLDNNYNIWMKHEGTRNLYKFNPQIDEMQAFKVPCSGTGTGFQIVAHIPSFIRLKDALMPTDATIDTAIEVFHYGYKLWSP